MVSNALGRFKYRLFYCFGVLCLIVLIGVGVFARNGWLPSTDAMTGNKTGWFGKELPKNLSSSWNPMAAPLPTATPQLSKEYIYAGSRLLAVEDANANAAPPADLAVWRPSSGVWYVLGGAGSAQTTYTFGAAGDKPIQGDFDGDGKTDFSVFRPSTGVWYITKSSDGSYYTVSLGLSSDLPAVADYDGDGKTDVAIYRQSSGTWYIIRSSDATLMYPTYGSSTDIPAPADYDGDGKADLALWRDSDHTFYTFKSTTSSSQSISIGATGDKPVPGDYDGDGKANYAVRSSASWIILNSAGTSTTTTTPSGDQSGDIPVQNDYDGDGKVDIAVWRPIDSPAGTVGHWYIRKSGSANALRQEAWGTAGDTPVPAFYRR